MGNVIHLPAPVPPATGELPDGTLPSAALRAQMAALRTGATSMRVWNGNSWVLLRAGEASDTFAAANIESAATARAELKIVEAKLGRPRKANDEEVRAFYVKALASCGRRVVKATAKTAQHFGLSLRQVQRKVQLKNRRRQP
jgi:hypothetical protein